MSKREERLKKEFKKYLSDPWKDGVETFSTDELEKEIIRAQKSIEESERDRDNDAKLESLKQQLRDAMAMYKDAIKLERLKIAFIIYIMKERGLA